MRVPFPYPLSVGTDIIAHNRLLRILQSSKPTHIHRLVNRFLHPEEITILGKRFPDWQQCRFHDAAHQNQLATWLAGRWAAKEAAKKAWGAHLISFRDLRVERHQHGDVEIICQSYHKLGTEVDQSNNTEQAAKLSISHDGDYAVATVIASPLQPDILAALEARKVLIQRRNVTDIGSVTVGND